MSPRFVALVALSFVLSACAEQGAPEQTSVSVTVELSAAEIGADRLEYIVSHPTAVARHHRRQPRGHQRHVELPPDVPSGRRQLHTVVGRLSGYRRTLLRRVANFDIIDGETTDVDMMLTCSTSVDNPNGEVGVNVTFQLNYCPVIEDIDYGASAFLGDAIDLSVVGDGSRRHCAPPDHLELRFQLGNRSATRPRRPRPTPVTVGPDVILIDVSDTDRLASRTDSLRSSAFRSRAVAMAWPNVTRFVTTASMTAARASACPGLRSSFRTAATTMMEGTEICDDGTNDGVRGRVPVGLPQVPELRRRCHRWDRGL